VTAPEVRAEERLARDADRRTRPRRPLLVELAAAVLVIGGAFGLLNSIDVILRLGEAGEAVDTLALLTLGIGIGFVVLGVLVRSGRAWLLAVNVVTVVGFLELTSGTIPGLFFGALDVFVVLALFWERPWFQSPAEPEATDLYVSP
jgi:hypothetical protein